MSSDGTRQTSHSPTPRLDRDDVDVLELYDPFSFEIIRQLEAFRFCPDGEGGPFVADGHIADRRQPPRHDRRRNHVVQPRGHQPADDAACHSCASSSFEVTQAPLQVPDAHIALCSNGGAGALFTTVLLLGDQPR